MSTNKTEHYQLNQWVKSDQVLMDDFNTDNQKLDQALNALAEKDAALETLIGGRGNCEMEVLTYTGTGTCGAGSPTRVSFSDPPDIFVIFGDYAILVGYRGVRTALFASKDVSTGNWINTIAVTWNVSQASFYNTIEPRYQLNTKGQTYVAVGLTRR